MAIDTLGVLKKYHLLTKKSLGQNFLYDNEILQKIIQISLPINTNEIIEIGPGLGSLTSEILKSTNCYIYCIEKDTSLQIVHCDLFKNENKLKFIYQDVLNIKLKEIINNKCTIIANLPYNVGTAILMKLFKEDLSYIDKMILMFQKEVAERICAPINTKQYGKISVLSQLLCEVKIMLDVFPTSFIPQPKVMSSVVIFKPKEIKNINLDKLMSLLNICFQARRKMLYTNLKRYYKNTDMVLNDCKNLRPENITPERFLELSQILERF